MSTPNKRIEQNARRSETLDRAALTGRVGALPAKKLELVPLGIDIVLGR